MWGIQSTARLCTLLGAVILSCSLYLLYRTHITVSFDERHSPPHSQVEVFHGTISVPVDHTATEIENSGDIQFSLQWVWVSTDDGVFSIREGLSSADSSPYQPEILGIYCGDFNGDMIPDIVVMFATHSAETALSKEPLYNLRYSMLVNVPIDSDAVSANRSQFRVLSEAAVGLDAFQFAGLGLTLLLDVDGDYDLDVCHVNWAEKCDQMSLQCALNQLSHEAKSQQADPFFEILQPVDSTVESAGVKRSRPDVMIPISRETLTNSPLLSVLAMDWNVDGSVEVLGSVDVHRGRQPFCSMSFTDDLPSSLSQNDRITDTAVENGRHISNMSTLSPCRNMILADLELDFVVELLCFGARFPSDLRIFHAGVPSMKETTDDYMFRELDNNFDRDFRISLVAVGDFNRDSIQDFVLVTEDFDLVMALSATKPNTAYAQSFRFDRDALPTLQDTEIVSLVCCDLDNDGDLDVITIQQDRFRKQASRIVSYYNLNQAGNVFDVRLQLRSILSVGLIATALIVLDYDLDGWLDVLVAFKGGTLHLYGRDKPLSNDNAKTNNWLKVSLVGVQNSNKLGNGAIVVVTLDGGRVRISRVVQGVGLRTNAVQTQPEHAVHFGLGAHLVVDSVSIWWPEFNYFEENLLKYHDVAANQHLHIVRFWSNPTVPRVQRILQGYHFVEGGCAVVTNLRLRPSFFIIGQAKCGTTTLAHDLRQHSQIRMPVGKELQYFLNLHEWLPLNWYEAQFPCGAAGQVTFEATASYLYVPWASRLLLNAYPSAKLIVLLRDPVARTFSHYRMDQRVITGNSNISIHDFHQYIVQMIADFRQCITEHNQTDTSSNAPIADRAADTCAMRWPVLTFSLYSVLLQRWLQLRPDRTLLLVTSFEYMLRDPVAVLNNVFEFIGVEQMLDVDVSHENAAPGGSLHMLSETELLLKAFYRPFNLELIDLITFHKEPIPKWIDS